MRRGRGVRATPDLKSMLPSPRHIRREQWWIARRRQLLNYKSWNHFEIFMLKHTDNEIFQRGFCNTGLILLYSCIFWTCNIEVVAPRKRNSKKIKMRIRRAMMCCKKCTAIFHFRKKWGNVASNVLWNEINCLTRYGGWCDFLLCAHIQDWRCPL